MRTSTIYILATCKERVKLQRYGRGLSSFFASLSRSPFPLFPLPDSFNLSPYYVIIDMVYI